MENKRFLTAQDVMEMLDVLLSYELLEKIEKEWMSEHKPKQANSFVEMYRLRTQARMIAEEVS